MRTSQERKTRGTDASSALFREYQRTRDALLRERLVQAHTKLAAYLARKFAFRGEPIEDLVQVAHVGLILAVDRFDPERGVKFVSYATEVMVGEIKRHFRDRSWSVHVPRRLRERNHALMQVVDRLSAQLGRSPTLAEIAEAGGVSFEDAVEALEVGRAYNPVSLDTDQATAGGEEVAAHVETIGTEDPELGRLETRSTLQAALAVLPEREQTILRLRYVEEKSQADIAGQLGISQMHVSRIQRAALDRLRTMLID
jgi:RNA polymerase sigma-B factor